MTDFTLHTAETAPEAAKPLIEASQKRYGMLPNLHATLAESPETYEAYGALQGLFGKTSLGTVEKHVVLIAINVDNRCHYCVPAHSFLALKDGVSEETVAALREDRALPDARLEALRQFTKALIANRGHLADAEVAAFLAAGFTKQNVFEVILASAYKTISNYTNHLARTPVDPPFQKYAWSEATAAAE
ncbi:MAG: carboxymuconolactone decarboxylase family protein [Pseudomonadota bacterium]